MKGTVKWYNARKGYGFITPDDNSDDVFIHATALKDSGLKKLYTGSEVSFEVDQDDKGKRAKSIKITKEVKLEQIKKKDVKKKEVKTEKQETKKDIKKDIKKETKKDIKKETKKETKKDIKKEQKKPNKKTEEKKTKGSNKK